MLAPRALARNRRCRTGFATSRLRLLALKPLLPGFCRRAGWTRLSVLRRMRRRTWSYTPLGPDDLRPFDHAREIASSRRFPGGFPCATAGFSGQRESARSPSDLSPVRRRLRTSLLTSIGTISSQVQSRRKAKNRCVEEPAVLFERYKSRKINHIGAQKNSGQNSKGARYGRR